MRATNGLQTTITLDPVNSDGQAFSLDMLLEMTLPMPPQDQHLPDQIEGYVHQAGLVIQRKLFQVLIEKADKELVLQQRHGQGGAGIQRRGTRPHTFKTTFGERTSPSIKNGTGRGYGSPAHEWRSTTTGKCRDDASTRG